LYNGVEEWNYFGTMVIELEHVYRRYKIRIHEYCYTDNWQL